MVVGLHPRLLPPSHVPQANVAVDEARATPTEGLRLRPTEPGVLAQLSGAQHSPAETTINEAHELNASARAALLGAMIPRCAAATGLVLAVLATPAVGNGGCPVHEYLSHDGTECLNDGIESMGVSGVGMAAEGIAALAKAVANRTATPMDVVGALPGGKFAKAATSTKKMAQASNSARKQTQQAIQDLEDKRGLSFGQNFVFTKGAKGKDGVQEKVTKIKDPDAQMDLPAAERTKDGKYVLWEGHHTAVAMEKSGTFDDAPELVQMIKDGATQAGRIGVKRVAPKDVKIDGS